MKGCPRNFRHCETKNFRRKNVIPLFSSIKLFETRKFLKNSRNPLQKFSSLWDKKISTENCDMPLFFRYQKFSGKQKGSCTKLSVSVLWDKTFQKTVMPSPLSYAWEFSIKELYWNTKVFSNELFQYSETKHRRKIVIPPPSYPNFFDTRIYCNSKRFPYGNFRHCETINFRRKNLILPPTSYPNFFGTRK